MQAHAAALAVPAQNPVAAIFNLEDPAESYMLGVIQRFHTDCDKLHAIKRGTREVGGAQQRYVWTISSFLARCPKAIRAWSVITWNVDVVDVRVQRCKDEAEARAVYEKAAEPSPDAHGIKMARPPTLRSGE